VTVPRINFIVEGHTEETFADRMLRPYLEERGIYLTGVRRIETGRHRTTIFRGGITSYQKAKRDIERWLREDGTAYLSTMFDLYALPKDFPNFAESTREPDIYEKVRMLEDGMTRNIGHVHFIPYIQTHEFEGLLFSEVAALDAVLRPFSDTSRLTDLSRIRADFPTPEHIDEGETTCPSKRLLQIFPMYDKVSFGTLIAQKIGVKKMRDECPHFADWLGRIESLKAINRSL